MSMIRTPSLKRAARTAFFASIYHRKVAVVRKNGVWVAKVVA